MADEKTAPSKDEINEVRTWLEQNKASVPQSIFEILIRMLAVYAAFAQSASKAKATLRRLREAMGLLPKSDHGKSQNVLALTASSQDSLLLDEMTPEDQQQYDQIKKKRDEMRLNAAL